MEAYERVIREFPLLENLGVEKQKLKAIIGLVYAIGNRDGVREGAEWITARLGLQDSVRRQNEALQNKAAD